MSLPRRHVLRLAASAGALAALPRIAVAQSYPARPVHLVVGFPAGSGVDIVARLMAQWLSERLGQPFVVENRPGAASNIATEAVTRTAPDGYTLLWVGPPAAINASLYGKLNFNFLRDIAPVAGINLEPSVMEVHPSVPATTVPEFIAYAKANRGKISMGSAGNGTVSHVAGELFKMMAGIDMVHVPYRGGGPAVIDLIAGQVQVVFITPSGSIEHVRSGKLRALAVTTATRAPALPDVPTMNEFIPGFEASGFYGVGAPKETPRDIVDRLNTEINSGLADPRIKARLADLGATVLVRSPAEFGKLVADETEKWAKVVKFAALKAD